MAASSEDINPCSIIPFNSSQYPRHQQATFIRLHSLLQLSEPIQRVALALRGPGGGRGVIPRVTFSWGSPETDSRRGAEFVPSIRPTVPLPIIFCFRIHMDGHLHTLIPRFHGILLLCSKGFISHRTGGTVTSKYCMNLNHSKFFGLSDAWPTPGGTSFRFLL